MAQRWRWRRWVKLRGREVATTRESILDELEDARQIAREAKNGSAMAMATLRFAGSSSIAVKSVTSEHSITSPMTS
jgi:hypothetical protein